MAMKEEMEEERNPAMKDILKNIVVNKLMVNYL